MARPRTPIGAFGEISFTTMPNGQVQARTRFRDDDGRVRRAWVGIEAEQDKGDARGARVRIASVVPG